MKLRYKVIVLFMSMICLLSVITGTYSILQMKEKVIESAQSKLLSDLALSRTLIDARYPGQWNLKDSRLYKGNFAFNDQFDLVDEIGSLTGDTVTIFQGDTRIATNVIQEDGNRATNTQVSKAVADEVLGNGKTYIGKANVVGTWNQTVYEPILDSTNTIIGILYVGVPNTLYDNIAADFRTNLIIFIVVGIIAFSIVTWVIATRFFSPLAQLESATQRMVSGDLTAKVHVKSRDEIGSLAAAFNSMLDSFNSVLHNISLASSEVTAGSRQVSNSSMSLSQGATEQASAIQELTACIEDISHHMQLNSDNVQKANALSALVNEHATLSSQQMAELQTAIQEINQTSKDISKIIKVIDDISFQTNILSLNASVEAAQAGQHGKGFAVVAEEVHNLAAKSALAAKDTSALIKNSLKKVEDGIKIVDANASSLTEIISGINQMASAMNEISTATNEQTANIEQVSVGITQVAAIIQNTSAISEESASTSVQLSEQAEALENQVRRFQLE